MPKEALLSGVFTHVSDLTGNTPMVYLNKIFQGKAKIAAKLECMNPCLSVKDRIGKAMIDDAEKKGLISPGKTTIIEPTSGNTGVALAWYCSVKGYRCILTMPECMSVERRIVLQAYGAEVILTPTATGMLGSVAKAEQLAAEIPNSFTPQQFKNPCNPECHYRTTGPEIWAQTEGLLNFFVCAVGTGGTMSGCARYFKERKPTVHCAAVEPSESPVLSGGRPGPHSIQGIGAGFIPEVCDTSLIDSVIQVTSLQANLMARRLWREEGMSVGISSGAAVHAAVELAKRNDREGVLIVVIIPSYGERYLSTSMFDDIREESYGLSTHDVMEPLEG
eukprot:RCo009036